MSDAIAPALTPEAWASIAAGNGIPYGYGSSSILGDLSMLDREDISAAIAYLNAALPDTDPRKITWAMVDALCDALSSSECDADEGRAASGVVEVLASYLPPRHITPP